MLRRLSLVIIAAAVTAVTATTLSLRSDQQPENVTQLSLVEQSVNTEAEPSGWIALPLCAVSIDFHLHPATSYSKCTSLLC